ncbi:MAG: CHAT domain-containing protein, partial [Caldilinea sp.]|nr:CHAT domain-containing protein [Caldilinea sp.]
VQVRTRQTMPVEWATTQMNLANAYSDRIRGDKAANIERAIEGYEQTLQVTTRQAMPVEWATTQMNLATAYAKRIRGDKAANIERAIEGIEQALQVRTRQTMPVEWAQTQMNLANAYRNRIRGDKAENIERAIEGYEQALQVMTRQAIPVEWAQTVNNLATAYSDRIRGDKAENIERAIEGHEQALQVTTRQAMPVDYLATQRALARVTFEQARFDQAMTYAREALSVAEELYEASPTPDARRSVLENVAGAPHWLAYARCRGNGSEGRQQAVAVLEQFRARWLREALETSIDRPAGVAEALWSDFQAQARTVRELEAEVRLPDQTPGRRSFTQLSQLLDAARSDQRQTVDAIRTAAPDFLPQPSFAQIRAAAQSGPLVYLLATAAGGLALIVHGQKPSFSEKLGFSADPVEAVWLDDLRSTDVSAILYDVASEAEGRYLRGAAIGDHAALERSLATALPLLGERLLQPLVTRLATAYPHGTPVTLVASSNLGLLPLHAAPVTLDGRTAPFMDFFAVRYAPSATALHAAHQRTQRASTRLLAVGNPEHVTHPAHLTDWLAQEAVRLTPDAALPLLHAAATVAAVENALAAAVPEHLLFGCHGHFNIADPLQSGLALTDGKLTLARLLTSLRLDGVDLATLCACQTAITNFQQAQEEAVGLPAAFLQAGVRRVVGTLWSVEALPTVLLLRRYLTRMAEGASALSALHEAVRWLRTLPRAEALAQIAEVRKMNGDNALAAWYLDSIVATDPRFERQTPFAGPSDWAAFTYTGV